MEIVYRSQIKPKKTVQQKVDQENSPTKRDKLKI